MLFSGFLSQRLWAVSEDDYAAEWMNRFVF